MSDADAVTRLNAALEGRYRIERQLGAGGMATVYLADDLRHERKVALKVLKPELAAVVGADRFLTEIKTTANLQHPHILPLHDSGEADGFLFYVMPYVEGESLRERLDREHQLAVQDAVNITQKVARALDYAHNEGVVHRDIKPGNILLSKQGEPLVADFGIALAVAEAGGGRITETGLSLGTPHYMSPEQATGDLHVGIATDVYALGCVLYEMLIGEPPYTGSTAQAILGKIIQAEPVSATKTRSSVPANVDAAIRKSLEKLPADRFAAAGDFAAALADQSFRHADGVTPSVSVGRGQWTALTTVFAALAVALGAALGWSVLGPDPPIPVTRVSVDFPDDQELAGRGAFDISRDGQLLVYGGPSAAGDGFQLWARRWDALAATPIRDTENDGGIQPALSPDGAEVAFQTNGSIRVVSVQGGISRTVAPDAARCCVRWGPDGAWLYFNTPAQGLSRVPAAGGPVEIVTQIDTTTGVTQHLFLDVLPDGRAAVFNVFRGAGNPTIATVSFESGEVTELTSGGLFPRYSQGYLLFTDPDAGTLFAQPFDADELELSGSAVPIAEGLRAPTSGWSYFAASQTGVLVYSWGGGSRRLATNLVRVGLDGTQSVLAEFDRVAWFPRFSPDGTRLAYALSPDFSAAPDRPGDLWVMDVARGAQTRVTFEGNNNWYPIWTPDGDWLTHADAATNENQILSSRADGSGVVDTILAMSDRRFPTSWTPDGRTLAYYMGPAGTPTGSRDIWMAEVDGPELTPAPFIATSFAEMGAIFSPDGRWVAYVSNKSGQQDVYARPFPGPGPEVTISVGGGIEPVWSRSGDEIYYRREDELMVAPIRRTASTLTVGTARRVLADDYLRQAAGGAGGMANYDVVPDGSGFVMIEEVGNDVEQTRLHLVLNWLEDLAGRPES